MMTINQLADQYFRDLATDFRTDTDENLTAWLWFTCPAGLRVEVRARIEDIRAAEQERPDINS